MNLSFSNLRELTTDWKWSFGKRRHIHPSERKKSKEKTEHDIEKLKREYELKAACLQNFKNIPNLTEMSKACQQIEK